VILPILERQPAWAVWSGCVASAAVLTAISYVWVVQPSRDQQHLDNATAATSAQQESQAQALDSQLTILLADFDERRDALAKQPVALGNPRDLNRRIAAIIELAQHQGLEVLQLQPGETSPGEHYNLIHLRFEAAASFPEHLAFLDELHTVFADLSVVGLELKSPVRSPLPRPRAVINLVWFTQARPNAVAWAELGSDR